MSNVIIDREKIDILANAISDKSGVPVTMTLDEMVEAVDSIEIGGGITPTGNINITQAGVTNVTNYATATVPDNAVRNNGINGSFITINGARKWSATAWFDYLQNGMVNSGINYASKNIVYNAVASGTTITPSSSAQTIGGQNYMMEGAVTVSAVPSAEVDLNVGSEYYTESNNRKWRFRATASTDGNDGWYSGGVGSWVSRNAIASGTSVTPTESSQTIGGENYMMEGAVTVNAIPSNYVGSGIARKSSTDLTVSGATVTAPAGYYAEAASKSVSSMALPTAAASSATSGYTSKATIGRSTAAQYINIPPGYNSTGAYYVISAVANGSATGPTSLSGSSATITTGTNTITLTKTGVTTTPTVSAGYVSSATASTATVALTASVTVNPTPTASGATVTIPAGYYSAQTTKSVTSGSATAPSSISGTAASVSTGTNTLTLTKTVSVTPTVSAGYVSAGTAGNSSVSLTASVTTKAAATITPTTTNQTIAAGTYLTGIQTIAGDADLVGSNILSTANIFGVQGSVVVQNYYTGSSAPSSSLGSNGDLYLQS